MGWLATALALSQMMRLAAASRSVKDRRHGTKNRIIDARGTGYRPTACVRSNVDTSTYRLAVRG